MTNSKGKANFTFSDASNLKTIDIHGLVAKRSIKKHLSAEKRQPHRNRGVRSPKKTIEHD